MTPSVSTQAAPATARDARVIALVSAAHFVSHYFILLLPPLFLFIRADYQVSYTQIGLALMAFNLTSMAFQTPAGYIVDRVSPCDVLIGGLVLGAASADAQGRRGPRGVPPGHLPPPGSCRVWYEGVPPGHQPPPTDCYRAHREAAHDPYAVVVYGARGSGWRGGHKHAGGWGAERIHLAFEYGYEDGYAGGRIDVGHGGYDPWRHDGYRHGDRGYKGRHDSRARYRD